VTALPGNVEDLRPIDGVTILGIGHKARHGKDMAASIMHSYLPQTSRILNFADDLKALCRAAYGMTVKDGKLLQEVGQAQREVDYHHWVKAMYWRIVELKPRLVIIPDVRYQNEADWIKRMGGTMLKVERRDKGVLFIDPDRDGTHISENELNDYQWDSVLRNDLDERAFQSAVRTWWTLHSSHLLKEKTL
jgi:hypothetical protein